MKEPPPGSVFTSLGAAACWGELYSLHAMVSSWLAWPLSRAAPPPSALRGSRWGACRSLPRCGGLLPHLVQHADPVLRVLQSGLGSIEDATQAVRALIGQ